MFPGNDRPGVMLASAARTYLNRYGVRVGNRAVVAAGSDAAYQAALELATAGVAIAAIADVRAADHAPGPAETAARSAGLPIEAAATILGTSGGLRVSGVQLGRVAADGTVSAGASHACDVVLMSGGYTPSVHLHSQSRGKLAYDETLGAFVPAAAAERTRSAGTARGVSGLAAVLGDGAAAGAAAAAAAGHAGAPARYAARALDAGIAGQPGALPQLPGPTPPAKAFVDFQNDVTTRDLALAQREGFESIEHIKRYTTPAWRPTRARPPASTRSASSPRSRTGVSR